MSKRGIERGDVQVGAPAFLQNLLPLHFPVHDAGGNSIVIEFTGGRPMIYDNPVGTLTNQPVFPWHLENLRNYVDITPWDFPTMTINGWKLAPTGHGTGMMHLPSDPTPPSRFVKATMMSHFADPVETLDEGITLAFHILNTVDIPRGINKYKNTFGGTASDYTQWAVVKDLARKAYSVRLYGSPLVYSVNLLDVDWKALNGKQVAVPASPVTLNLNHGGPENLAARAIDPEPLRVLLPSSGTGG